MKPEQFFRIAGMLLVAGTCLFTGCARLDTGRLTSFTIKVVDERNNRPIPGVSALYREDIDDLMLGHYQIGPTNLQPSNDAGMIKVFPVRDGMVGYLILSRPGSFTLYCVYGQGQLEFSNGIVPTDPVLPGDGDFTLSDPHREAVWTNGCFAVQMTATNE